MDALENEKTALEIERLRIEVQKEQVELLKALNDVEIWHRENWQSMINRRVVRLTDEINDDSVGEARNSLYELSRLFPGQPLILDLNSGGGSIAAGLELYGVLRELSKEGHQIITRIGGEACSMAGVIAQAGDVRQIRENSYLHIHEAGWQSIGKASSMMESAEVVERMTKDLLGIYAKRGVKSVDELYERVLRREWYLGAQEALAEGFVDQII